MPAVTERLIAALAAGVIVLAPVEAGPQTAPPLSERSGAQLTGKERLGQKWKDEQRIDNCKVPLDKRGTTPRPGNCRHLPSS